MLGSRLTALKNCATALGLSETGNSHQWSHSGVRGSARKVGTCKMALHLCSRPHTAVPRLTVLRCHEKKVKKKPLSQMGCMVEPIASICALLPPPPLPPHCYHLIPFESKWSCVSLRG